MITMDEDEFVYGEWVAYQPPYMEEPEIGRFVRYTDYGSVVICFHYGCTAASSPIEYVRYAMEDEIIDAIEQEQEYGGHIGYHRFDDTCDDYSPDVCFGCIHDEEATWERDGKSDSVSVIAAARRTAAVAR